MVRRHAFYSGVAMGAMLGALVAVLLLVMWGGPHATIGNDEVPTGLSCEEDEAIYLTPDGVTCGYLWAE